MTRAITYFEMRIKYTLTMHLDTCTYKRLQTRIKIRAKEKEKKRAEKEEEERRREIFMTITKQYTIDNT